MNNPPAFPIPDVPTHDGMGIGEGSPGMTLRDWFAGQALVGILSSPIGKLPDLNGGENKQAWGAYVMADAMLAARAQESNS